MFKPILPSVGWQSITITANDTIMITIAIIRNDNAIDTITIPITTRIAASTTITTNDNDNNNGNR